MKINDWQKPHHSKGLISHESSEPLCWLHLHNVSAYVSVFSPHQGWAYSRQSWVSSLHCGWRSSGPPSPRTPPAGWESWRWPTGSFLNYERPTRESDGRRDDCQCFGPPLPLNSFKAISYNTSCLDSTLVVPQWQFFAEQVWFPEESQRHWALSEVAGGEGPTHPAANSRTVEGQWQVTVRRHGCKDLAMLLHSCFQWLFSHVSMLDEFYRVKIIWVQHLR